MSTETQQALAVLFGRFREEAVSRDDLVKAMSLELDWTKPSRAENLLDRGLNAGHLETRDDGLLVARFTIEDVEIPFGFSPSEGIFDPVETGTQTEADADAPAEAETEGSNADAQQAQAGPGEEGSLLDQLLDRIAEALDGDRKRAVAAANAKQEAMGELVTLETAALLVAHGEGLEVASLAEDLLAQLQQR